MLKQAKKNWIHLLIWGIVIIFVLIAPGLYALFVVKEGKPVRFTQELPPPTDQIKLSIDRLDPITEKGQNLYDLWGWAFFLGDPDQSAYDRYAVLRADKTTYFYPLKVLERPELTLAFKDISFDIRNAGFSALISQDVIRPGSYLIGILFKHRSSGDVYYAVSQKALTRTPNTLSLNVYQATEQNNPPVSLLAAQPSELKENLPTVTDQIKYAIDRLDPMTSNEKTIYNLWGWAFYLGDSNQSGYERYIILQSGSKTLSFPTTPFERPDLQKAFPDLNIDIHNTGFSTYLSTDDLPEGAYRVGILFKSVSTGSQYFIVTNKEITQSAGLMQLELAGK